MPVACSICDRVFPTLVKRNLHLRSRHIRCDVCNLAFNSKARFNQHVVRVHNDLVDQLPNREVYKCDHCGLQFLYRKSRNEHIRQNHLMSRLAVRCSLCRQDFKTLDDLRQHKANEHIYDEDVGFILQQNAFRDGCEVLRLQLPDRGDNVIKSADEFFDKYSDNVKRELKNQLLKRNGVFKVWLVLFVEMTKPNIADSENQLTEFDTFYFRSDKSISSISDVDDISNFLKVSRSQIRLHFDSFMTRGSNWTVEAVTACTLEIAKSKSLNGGCIIENVTISTLNDLKNLKYIYKDNRKFRNGCLFYAIAKYYNRESDDIKVLDKWIEKKLKHKNIKTPVSLSKIDNLERQNSDLNFKINVLELEVVEDHRDQICNVYPLRSSPYKAAKDIINVLWVRFFSEVVMNRVKDRKPQFCEFGGYGTDLEKEYFSEEDFSDRDEIDSILVDTFKKDYGRRGHFMLIENLDIFLFNKHMRFICSNCLTGFRSYILFEKHENVCMHFKPALVEMPKAGSKMKFKNFNYKFKLPYVIFYDFEAVLEPMPTESRCCNCVDKNNEICTHKVKMLNRQIPSCYSMIVVDNDYNICLSSVYTGFDCVQHFLKTIFSFRNAIFKELQKSKPMIITSQQENEYKNAKICHICDRPFDDKRAYLGKKCHDHDHLTGLYLGPAHNQCNVLRQKSFNIPAVCHNAAKYDSHFILTELHTVLKPGNISAIPVNTESFKKFSIGGIHFLDSMAFLNMSLSQLANDLKLVPNFEYKILDALGLYSIDEQEKKELLLSKQIYPYEYITSFEKYLEVALPPKSAFFSRLSNKGISEEDYEHAAKVFEMFGCENLKDYTELYCLLDVGLLAEVVMQFRSIIFNDGQLDLMHYMSLPQLTLDYMLKMTGNEIELLSDSTMHSLLEQNIRGGVVFCSERYFLNRPNDFTSDVIYVDMNNLYGHAMSALLPYSSYEWINVSDLEKIDWYNVNTEGEIGFILEVDLEYPRDLHDKHFDFPVGPVNQDINFNQLSPYAKACLQNLRNVESYSAKKLIASFETKRNYVIHFANLKYYLELGLKLLKIHSGFSFRQKKCFESYVKYCTEKRKNSVSRFQGSTYKTLSNSLFGKTMESKRDRLKCRFVMNRSFCEKYISESNSTSFKILNQKLVCIFEKQRNILMDKPIAIGFTILERAKLLMYELYYSKIKPKFAFTRCLYTDTDSLLLFVKKFEKDYGRDSFEIIKDLMDFSNYPSSHQLYSCERKNQLGFIKNELPVSPLFQFVGLRSKTYCIETLNNEIIRKAKGVSYNYQNTISFDSYLQCLFKIKDNTIEQVVIRSINHRIFTQSVCKVSFSSFDDKRFLYNCGIHTTAYGDYKITESGKCIHCDKDVI